MLYYVLSIQAIGFYSILFSIQKPFKRTQTEQHN